MEKQTYNPLVSIIIPVYNGANYLEHAINCALSQTYKNIEILVVNDGSTDNGATESVVRKYADKVRYFHKENGGVSSALNSAIREMKGEWFSWLSHDDGYKEEKIEKQVSAVNKLMEEEKLAPEQIVIYGANERINSVGQVILKRKYSITNKETNIDLILDNIARYNICGCAVLVHRKKLEEIGGFNESIRTVSDAECFYRLLFNGCRFYFLYDVLVQSRQHKQQVGKTKVALFEREGDEFHIWVLNEILKREEWKKPKYLLRYFAGATKRGLKQSKKYCAETIRNLYGKKYNFKMQLISFKMSIVRVVRGIVRKIYRRIVVK